MNHIRKRKALGIGMSMFISTFQCSSSDFNIQTKNWGINNFQDIATYLRTTSKYYSWICPKNLSKLKTIHRRQKLNGWLHFISRKKYSRNIQIEYLVFTHHFYYRISMLLQKVVVDTSDSSEVQLIKDQLLFRKDKAFDHWDKSLSMFLKLGKHVTFLNNLKVFYKTINMFCTEYILSVLNMFCHIFFHFYIFQGSKFCISSCSCWVGHYWKLN